MGESNGVKINVVIAGRSYRFNVDKTEEDNVVKAAEMINSRIDEFKRVYSDKDFQSWITLACIQFATTVVKNEKDSAFKDQHLDEQLDVIDKLLTENIDLSV